MKTYASRTSVIWLIRDAANAEFLDYVDINRASRLVIPPENYNRLRAFVAVHMLPYTERRVENYRVGFFRTLSYGKTTMETSNCLMRMMDVRLETVVRTPSDQWHFLLKNRAYEDSNEDRGLRDFPLLAEDVGELVAYLMETCSHMNALPDFDDHPSPTFSDRFDSTAFILLEPFISSVVELLTGKLPPKVIKPGEGVRLVFVKSQLVSVEQKSLDVQSDSDLFFSR